MRERIGLDGGKIVVIPGGVDIDRFPAAPFDPRQLGVPATRRFLLFVGRLDADDQKGASRLLDNARSLLDRLPEYDLVLVGDGSAAAALRRRTAELGLQDRLHWLGWRSDVPEIIAAADMLLAPSRWEGMSNVVLEAMASGKPIVAQNAEGIADLFFDGAAARRRSSEGKVAFDRQAVAIGDLHGFNDRIAAITANPTLKAQLGLLNRDQSRSDSAWTA